MKCSLLFQNCLSKVFPCTCMKQHNICNKITDHNPYGITDLFIAEFHYSYAIFSKTLNCCMLSIGIIQVIQTAWSVAVKEVPFGTEPRAEKTV
jgi:hypothetical protein